MNEERIKNTIRLEEAILGSILIDYRCVDIVMANLIEDDFYFHKNNQLFNVFKSMSESNKKIDLLTTFEEIKKIKTELDISYLMEISNKVMSSSNIETHIEYLKAESILRQCMMFAHGIVGEVNKMEKDPSTILNNLIHEAKTLQDRTVIQRDITFKEKFILTVDECFKNEGKEIIGINTGFAHLDKVMGGLIGPDYTVFAAGPGEGKTSFALNIAKHISINYGDVIMFSYEMKERQLIWKLMSDDLNISVKEVRLGKFDKDYINKTKTYNAKLHIYDKGSITIKELCSICKMQAKKLDLKLIVIDYLQLVKIGNYHRKISNKGDEVGIISNELKQLAMELNIPLIALSQVSRDKTRKRYRMSDLRETGAIEQDADNIIMIFRPIEHDMNSYTIGSGQPIPCDATTAIINIEKCRLGDTGEFQMKFNGKCSRFEDLDKTLFEDTETPF